MKVTELSEVTLVKELYQFGIPPLQVADNLTLDPVLIVVSAPNGASKPGFIVRATLVKTIGHLSPLQRTL